MQEFVRENTRIGVLFKKRQFNLPHSRLEVFSEIESDVAGERKLHFVWDRQIAGCLVGTEAASGDYWAGESLDQVFVLQVCLAITEMHEAPTVTCGRHDAFCGFLGIFTDRQIFKGGTLVYEKSDCGEIVFPGAWSVRPEKPERHACRPTKDSAPERGQDAGDSVCFALVAGKTEPS